MPPPFSHIMAGNKRKRNVKDIAPVATGIKYFFDNQRRRQQLEQDASSISSPLQPSFRSTPIQQGDAIASGPLKTSELGQDTIDVQKDLAVHAQSQTRKAVEPKYQTAPILSLGGNAGDESVQSQPLTTNALYFDPYAYPVSTWPSLKGRRCAPYSFLASAFALMGDTSSRIVMIDVLCNMLQVIMVHTPDDVLPCLWLCSSNLGSGVELGIGPQVLTKALSAVSGGLPASRLRKLYQDHGDWGDVAYAIKANIRTIAGSPQSLRVRYVFDQLRVVLARLKGKGMVAQKAGVVQRLLVTCQSGTEARYLIRTCVGNLRTGAVEKTVLLALARACVLINRPAIRRAGEVDDVFQRAQAVLKECYAQCPSWDLLLPWLKETRWDVDRIFERCGITVGVPLKPMLGQITRSLADVFIKLASRHFVCESKYDGQRAQIHMDDQGNAKLYSRHLEDMTEKYPDIVRVLPEICELETKSFIMDAEIVAVTEEGKIQPFQILSNRERKNVTVSGIKVRVCIMAFDLMYLNGVSLLRLSFRDRRDRLFRHFKRIPGVFDFTCSLTAFGSPDSFEMVERFFKESIKQGCEGMMVKVLDQPSEEKQKQLLSTYEPDKRLESWLKVKKDYLEGIGDSLDLVPIGAWYGNGRKVGWFSPVLLACYNPENGTFESVCKCMSGFSDAFYKSMKQFYSETNDVGTTRILEHPRHDYVTNLQPDGNYAAAKGGLFVCLFV
ncbi:ATP-dependent DNA ligase [Dichotomocladium elegans]|nr:ATP-dependent DNA ligase [Dichotomocladium elegans]